jgi:hypothetical protein
MLLRHIHIRVELGHRRINRFRESTLQRTQRFSSTFWCPESELPNSRRVGKAGVHSGSAKLVHRSRFRAKESIFGKGNLSEVHERALEYGIWRR